MCVGEIKWSERFTSPVVKELPVGSIVVPSESIPILIFSNLLGVGEVEAPTENLSAFARADPANVELLEVVRRAVPRSYVAQALDDGALGVALDDLVVGHGQDGSHIAVANLEVDPHAPCEVAYDSSQLLEQAAVKLSSL